MGFTTAAVVLDFVTELDKCLPSRQYRDIAAKLISAEMSKLLRYAIL